VLCVRGTPFAALRACHPPLGIALALLAACLPCATAADQPDPVFVVHTSVGKEVRGPLRALRKDWSVTVAGGEDTTVPGADVVTVRRADHALPPLPSGEHLILANGDRVPARAPRLDGERLYFTNPDVDGGKETSVPLTAVSVLWRATPERTDDPEALRRRLAVASRSQDVVLLRNGDVLAGVLNSLDGDKAVVEVDKRSVPVPLAQVAAVALSTELAQAPRPKGVHAQVVLAGGGRLSVTSAAAEGGRLTAQTVFGATLRVPLEGVAAVDLRGGRAVYLSDLSPAKYEFFPYLDESWPLARDANAVGHDLRLAGATYGKGLGLHSRSRVLYRLGGAYRRFEAVVGLDEQDGREGSVRVRVLADGKALRLGGPDELTAATGPVAVSVGVEGVRELTLEVDFGRGGNVQDVVDWGDARLVR
jgi:hypothetical protein